MRGFFGKARKEWLLHVPVTRIAENVSELLAKTE